MRFFLLSTVLVLSLTGCRTLWDPTPVPAGYAHHQGAYNSPPGPEAKNIGYDYSAAENEAALNEWRHAVRDLLLKARAHDIKMPENLKLVSDLPAGAFRSSYDHVLREGLRAYGHTLSPHDDNAATALFYSAAHPDKESGADPEAFELIIGFPEGENDILASETRGIYNIPAYGFRKASYDFGLTGFSAKNASDDERDPYNP